MTSSTELHKMGDTLALAGELTFLSVPRLWRDNKRLFRDAASPATEISVDLAKVVRADSAGLALMLEWRRQANHRNITLRFQNIPEQMLSLANLAEVDFLFDDRAVKNLT
uniref:Phospholipid transport system transporter-binding protein n=1 Tax=Candidatus Kentrum sp. DK TaxID=2126562 RepID=A0A450TI51_9GAMM|nr:MAG: phospholipid transport system transporter-binding protein [Candidatus Kentron sp. DK]